MRTICPNGTDPSQALRELDQIHGTSFGSAVDDDVAGELRSQWTFLDNGPQNATAIADKIGVARRALGAGLSMHQAARLFACRPTDIAMLFSKENTRAGVILEVERMLRGRAGSHAQIGRTAGCSSQAVDRIAEVIGVQSDAAERRAAGGGFKYTAEQLAEIAELRAGGMSYGQIAKTTKINLHSVKSYCRRHLAVAR